MLDRESEARPVRPDIRHALGDRLTISRERLPVARQHAADLNNVPAALLQRLVDAGLQKIRIGNGRITDFPEGAALKDLPPRGWPAGAKMADLPGVYEPNSRAILAGAGSHPEALAGTIPEEIGHAIGHLLGHDDDPRTIEFHKLLYKRLVPYLKQDGPGGPAGRQEMFADAVRRVIQFGVDDAAREYSAEFAEHVAKIIYG